MKAVVHFSKIKDEIIANLKKANYTIKIAVAWFTDEDIIRVLSQQRESGVDIEVVISDSKENFENLNNFNDYLRNKAKLFISTKVFLHHKFCIIDDNIIINGSYNWSYAARRNEENITVISLDNKEKEDEDFLKRFTVKHKFLCERCSVIILDIASLRAFKINSKDFAVIQSNLDEEEILLRQEFENMVKESIEKARVVGIQLSASFLERMARDGGGVDFVKRILSDEMTSGDMKSGFRKLEAHIPHRVDLSLEYLVSRPKYEDLFSDKEIQFCKKLMSKYNL